MFADNFQGQPFFLLQPQYGQVDKCWAVTHKPANLAQPPDSRKSLETVTETSRIYYMSEYTPPCMTVGKQDMAAISATLEESGYIYRGIDIMLAQQLPMKPVAAAHPL